MKLLFMMVWISLVFFNTRPVRSDDADAAAGSKQHTIIVGPGLTFTPKCLTIRVGDSVLWKWAENKNKKIPHTVTASPSWEQICEKDANGFHSGIKYTGDTYSLDNFTKPGKVPYHCETSNDLMDKTCQNCRFGMYGQLVVLDKGEESKADENAECDNDKGQKSKAKQAFKPPVEIKPEIPFGF